MTAVRYHELDTRFENVALHTAKRIGEVSTQSVFPLRGTLAHPPLPLPLKLLEGVKSIQRNANEYLVENDQDYSAERAFIFDLITMLNECETNKRAVIAQIEQLVTTMIETEEHIKITGEEANDFRIYLALSLTDIYRDSGDKFEFADRMIHKFLRDLATKIK